MHLMINLGLFSQIECWK